MPVRDRDTQRRRERDEGMQQVGPRTQSVGGLVHARNARFEALTTGKELRQEDEHQRGDYRKHGADGSDPEKPPFVHSLVTLRPVWMLPNRLHRSRPPFSGTCGSPAWPRISAASSSP